MKSLISVVKLSTKCNNKFKDEWGIKHVPLDFTFYWVFMYLGCTKNDRPGNIHTGCI